MTKKVSVILAGCGYLDGAEIRESILSLLYLDKYGAEVECFAPNIQQHDVINHLEKTPLSQRRNVLEESARIARSDISDLKKLDASKFDALVLPGGFGVAKNLSDLAFKGSDTAVQADYAKAIRDFNSAKKPIGAICIAPAVVIATLRKGEVTIGDDVGTASAIKKMGGTHVNCATEEICVDEENKLVTTSAYMRDDRLSKISIGIEALIKKVLELA